MFKLMRSKKIVLSYLSVFSILFSGSVSAFEFDKVDVKSKLGEPLRIDFYLQDATKSFKVEEAKQDTYELFGTNRSMENNNFTIFKDTETKGLFHIKGSKTFNDPVIDIILNFKDTKNDTNYYKRINKEIEINGIKDYFKPLATTSKQIEVKKGIVKIEKAHKSVQADDGFYKTQIGDSLYKISEKHAVGANVVKIAAWIFQNNKNAFIKNNPNSLKAYYDIKVPTANDMKKYNITFDLATAIVTHRKTTPKYKGKINFSSSIKKTKHNNKYKKILKKEHQKTIIKRHDLITPKTAIEYERIVNVKTEQRILNEKKLELRINKLEIMLKKAEKSNIKYIEAVKNNQNLIKKVDNLELVNNILAAMNVVFVIIGFAYIISIINKRKRKDI